MRKPFVLLAALFVASCDLHSVITESVPITMRHIDYHAPVRYGHAPDMLFGSPQEITFSGRGDFVKPAQPAPVAAVAPTPAPAPAAPAPT
ncbi:MAG: hypothetical protein FWC83_02125, partial [Alphaproteobacteria bacterium]|nr:hypothetical protein [Alphaproteobacteria bacterium]